MDSCRNDLDLAKMHGITDASQRVVLDELLCD